MPRRRISLRLSQVISDDPLASGSLSPSLTRTITPESPTMNLCPPPADDGTDDFTDFGDDCFPATSYAQPEGTMIKRPSRHVGYVQSPTHSVHVSEVGVQPYSEVYGQHPRDFDFDAFGNKVKRLDPVLIGGPTNFRASYISSGGPFSYSCGSSMYAAQSAGLAGGMAASYGSADRFGGQSRGRRPSAGYDINIGGDGIF